MLEATGARGPGWGAVVEWPQSLLGCNVEMRALRRERSNDAHAGAERAAAAGAAGSDAAAGSITHRGARRSTGRAALAATAAAFRVLRALATRRRLCRRRWRHARCTAERRPGASRGSVHAGQAGQAGQGSTAGRGEGAANLARAASQPASLHPAARAVDTCARQRHPPIDPARNSRSLPVGAVERDWFTVQVILAAHKQLRLLLAPRLYRRRQQ
jgi:hypothetical protein